jgi:hypothetical protein
MSGILAARDWPSECKRGLGEAASVVSITPDIASRLRTGYQTPRGQIVEMGRNLLSKFVMVNRAGPDDNQISPNMMRVGPPFKTRSVDQTNATGVAQDRSTKGLIGKRNLIETMLREFLRIVSGFRDLLQNDFALAFDLVRWES